MTDGNDGILPYLIILRDNPPQTVMSSENLITQWKEGRKKIYKSQEWWQVIEFVDENSQVVAAYESRDIIGVIQGAMQAPEVKQSR